MSLCRPPGDSAVSRMWFPPPIPGNDSLLFVLCVLMGGARLPLRSPETARGTTPPATRTVFFPRFSSCPLLPLPFSPIPPAHSPPLIACRRWFSGRPFFPAHRPPGTGHADRVLCPLPLHVPRLPRPTQAPAPLPGGKDDSLPRVAARTCAAVLTEQERCAAPAPSSLPRSSPVRSSRPLPPHEKAPAVFPRTLPFPLPPCPLSSLPRPLFSARFPLFPRAHGRPPLEPPPITYGLAGSPPTQEPHRARPAADSARSSFPGQAVLLSLSPAFRDIDRTSSSEKASAVCFPSSIKTFYWLNQF